MWNVLSFRGLAHPLRAALQAQAAGVGISLLGAGMFTINAGSHAGPISIVVGLLLGALGIGALGMTPRIQVRP